MTDPSLAALSDTFFSLAVALYSLAVVAFCAELAFGGKHAPARSRELVGAGGGAVPTGSDAGTTTEPVKARRVGTAAMVLTALGAVVQAGVLVARGAATGRLP
ncbi:MAG: ccsB, partial [Klenkia sp.]|nr:ccsB [Klenkia sp.]